MLCSHIADVDRLLRILNTSDCWTEIDSQFLTVKDGLIHIYIWVGEVATNVG
jgi:hypothetical protein